MTQSNTPRFVPKALVPTTEQLAIQLSQHPVTLVEANAGAAKTTTLALRIGEALARGVAPERILALTFTPQARQVMKERLVDVGIAKSEVGRLNVLTIDEFSQQTLRRLEDIEPEYLSSAATQKPRALIALERLCANHADKTELLDISTHDLAVSQFLEAQLRLKASMAFDFFDTESPLEFVAQDLGVTLTDYLWTLEYERLRLGTFGQVGYRAPYDATYDLAVRLRDYPETREILPSYRLVVGDELHDLNEASFRVLEALLAQPGLYFVGVGDKDQVIYSPLGADEQYLSHRFPQNRRLPLTMTYRHGPHLAYAMAAFKSKTIESSLPLTTQMTELHYDSQTTASCARRVVDVIREWQAAGQRLNACAVLLRDRHQSVEVENALIHAGIGYRTGTMPSYLHRDEILFLRGMLAIALDNLATVRSDAVRRGIVAALALFGEVPLTPPELEEAKRMIAQDPTTLRFFFQGQIQRTGAVHASTRISRAVAYAQGLASDTPAHVALHDICEMVDMQALAKRIYVHPYDASVVEKSVRGYIDMAAQAALGLREFADWTGAADEFVTNRRGRNDVLVDCVANAKGSEFEHVILPFLAVGEFPSPLCKLKDEENLFYVGATRARTHLTLIAPEPEALRSPFIARMQLAETRTSAEDRVQQNLQQLPTSFTRQRQDLVASYADKDVVKALGARWDRTRKVWYVPEGLDPKPFSPWLR